MCTIGAVSYKNMIKKRFHYSTDSFEVFPSIFFFWALDYGVAIGWMFWTLELRAEKHIIWKR